MEYTVLKREIEMNQYKAIQDMMLQAACDRLAYAMDRQYSKPTQSIEHKGETLLVKVVR
jgi:hypothetical protein